MSSSIFCIQYYVLAWQDVYKKGLHIMDKTSPSRMQARVNLFSPVSTFYGEFLILTILLGAGVSLGGGVGGGVGEGVVAGRRNVTRF